MNLLFLGIQVAAVVVVVVVRKKFPPVEVYKAMPSGGSRFYLSIWEGADPIGLYCIIVIYLAGTERSKRSVAQICYLKWWNSIQRQFGWTFVDSNLYLNPHSFFPKVLDGSNHKGNKNVKTRYLFLIINCIVCLESFIPDGNFDNFPLYHCDTIPTYILFVYI